MSREYNFFNKVKIPTVACVQDWFTEKCAYCTNWSNASNIQQCTADNYPVFNLSNDNDYTTAKNYIWMHDWVDKNNLYSQTCTPSNSGQNPTSCTNNSSANTKNVIQNNYKNANATNWSANNVYIETRYSNDQL